MRGSGMTDTPLKRSRVYGPDVSVLELPPVTVVEKTYRSKVLPVKLFGSLLVSWESLIYAKLAGLPGIPECVPSSDRYTLSTTFMGGNNLKDTNVRVDEAYFSALENLISSIHHRGVVHLDLRNRRNYGIDEEGNPYLIDFASSIYLPRPRIVHTLLCTIDWMGFLKVKRRLRPDLVTREEHTNLGIGNALSLLWFPPRVMRGIRSGIKKVLR